MRQEEHVNGGRRRLIRQFVPAASVPRMKRKVRVTLRRRRGPCLDVRGRVAICYLASPNAGYTTGTALQIDGGTHSFVVPPVPGAKR